MGIAYYDIDEENHGENYREKTQVDIEKRPDASNGHGIGWTKKGEWLVYTVEVKESGTYHIEMPVASKKKGGVFHIEVNGKGCDRAHQCARYRQRADLEANHSQERCT